MEFHFTGLLYTRKFNIFVSNQTDIALKQCKELPSPKLWCFREVVRLRNLIAHQLKHTSLVCVK